MKQLWTLHIVQHKPKAPNGEPTYTVTRHLSNQPTGAGGGMPFTPPLSWEYLSRALEQVGCDAFKVAALKKMLDFKHSDDVHEMNLDETQLRVIGFTDV
jgi:hypothetical protein